MATTELQKSILAKKFMTDSVDLTNGAGHQRRCSDSLLEEELTRRLLRFRLVVTFLFCLRDRIDVLLVGGSLVGAVGSSVFDDINGINNNSASESVFTGGGMKQVFNVSTSSSNSNSSSPSSISIVMSLSSSDSASKLSSIPGASPDISFSFIIFFPRFPLFPG